MWFVDRGNDGAVLWIAFAIALPAIALYFPIFLKGANSLPGYKLDSFSIGMLICGAVCGYRAVRALARRSQLRIDLQNEQLEWEETWPTRRQFSVPLADTFWIVQPLVIRYTRSPNWNGYLLRVEVEKNSFVIAVLADPRRMRSALPPELRRLIHVHFIRSVATATLAM